MEPPPADRRQPDYRNKAVAIIGDSTFFHSGITSLMDVAYNNGNDAHHHRGQPHHGHDRRPGEPGHRQDPAGRALRSPWTCQRSVRALGIKRVRPSSTRTTSTSVEKVIREELAADEASVVIAKAPACCSSRSSGPSYQVDAELCIGCKRCLKAGCMALNLLRRRERRPQGGDRPGRSATAAASARSCAKKTPSCRPAAAEGREGLMTARPTTNMLLTGVGGQGVVLASFVLSHVAMSEGYDVKQSEVHGMSQRGGSVTSHFRFGDKVWSPLVSPGTADILMAFEALEALRYINWLKPGGLLVYNALRSTPARSPPVWPPTRPISTATSPRPGRNMQCVNANALASQAGTVKCGQRGHARRRLARPCRSRRRPGKRSSARRCRRRASTSTWRPSGWVWPLPPTPPLPARPAPRERTSTVSDRAHGARRKPRAASPAASGVRPRSP